MSYRVEGLADGPVVFEDGSSLLLSGSGTPVRDRLYDVLAEGLPDDEWVIVIGTDRDADRIADGIAERGALATGRIGIVDCASDSRTDREGVSVRTLGSPGDLTGMSLEFAKLVESIQQQGAGNRVRVGIDTVSTLLVYTDVRTVFRFLHVFTSRIRSAGMFGVFSIQPGMHDDQTTNTVRAIFDAEARVDEDGVTLQGSGFTEE